jgi:hypothetical protein
MTTIAWDGVMLAADKQVTECNRAAGVMTKIGRLDADRLWAVSGLVGNSVQALQWVRHGGSGPYPWPPEVELYVVHRDGRVDVYEQSAIPFTLDPGPFTAGSGGAAAQAAMQMGADAHVAVAIASTIDVYTGGGVDTLRFEPVVDE